MDRYAASLIGIFAVGVAVALLLVSADGLTVAVDDAIRARFLGGAR